MKCEGREGGPRGEGQRGVLLKIIVDVIMELFDRAELNDKTTSIMNTLRLRFYIEFRWLS